MTMMRRTTVNPNPRIIIIEIMTTDDDAAATWMNPKIQLAAIPGTMACHATEGVMAIQETTGQMVGDSRAFSAPWRHHRPQRGTILSSTELLCRAMGSVVTTVIHLGLHTALFFVSHITRKNQQKQRRNCPNKVRARS